MSVVVIRSLEELRRHRRGKVRLEIPGLPDAAAHEARLNRLLMACGCTEGSVGLLIALPIAITFGLVSTWPLGSGGRIAVGLAIVVAGSLAGKLVGLMRARAALRAEISAIEATLGAQPSLRILAFSGS